ncbi:MAG: IS200/IS605 family element transposase accessory protein TnpB [Bacilli bacterium]|nr:IS200/IS605 family element transposase accessory protein TnpB [Bacilli bacterium]
MYKAYLFRMYPNSIQTRLIHQTFGSVRFVYNHFLEQNKNGKYKSAYLMCKDLKNLNIDYPWLKDCDSCSLRCAIFDLEDAYQNFFHKRSQYPKYKNRFIKQSYRTNCIRSSNKGKEYSNIEIDFITRKIKLPKLGKVTIRGYRHLKKLEGRIIQATISKEPTGKYYVSVLVERNESIKEKVIPETIVGIDLGIKDFIVTSNGDRIKNPKEIQRREKRLKRYQRALSRQEYGSKNYQKTQMKLARIHSRIKQSRKYNIIGIVSKLVKENDIIVTETLKIKEMVKNTRLSKYISDASFGSIVRQLKRKCEEEGKYYYGIEPYYASSQICYECGYKNREVKDLKVRNWECPNCQVHHDRDINASLNIMYEGLKKHYQIS